jgi:peptide/nickel transport system substrate-binding protein
MGVGVTAGLAGCPGNTGSDGDDGGDGGDGGDTSTPDLPDVELYGPDDEQVSPTLFYQQGDSQSQNIATQIQRDLQTIGVDLQLNARTRQTLLGEDFFSEPLPDANPDEFEYGGVGRNAGPPDKTRTAADWDMLIGIVANSYPRTPDNTRAFWTKNGAANAYGYVPSSNNAELFEEFGNTTDEGRRQEIINTIFGNLSQELPANFLSQSKDYFAFRSNINTSEEFVEYGFSGTTANWYRDSQEVSGDFVWLATTPLTNLVIPEVDDGNSDDRISLVSDYAYDILPNNEVFPLFMDIQDTGDGQVYVCTLRDNLMFGEDADGNSYGQMTAEDWVWQTRNVHGVADNAADMWNEETPPSAQIGDYEAIDTIEQTGELEFQVTLNEVDPDFPLRPVLWGEYVLPKDLYQQYAPDAEALRQAPELQQFTWTGNLGAYQFESRTPGAAGEFTTSRNPDYYMREHVEDSNVQTVDSAWADAPYFERYQFDNEGEQSTATERFRNGGPDLYQPPTDTIQEFQQADEDVRVEGQEFPYISMMFFNLRSNGDPLLQAQAGRQAVASVVDKQVISNEIQRGFTTPTSTYQPTWSQWYDEEAVTEYGIGVSGDDIQSAREMLRGLDDFTLEEA